MATVTLSTDKWFFSGLPVVTLFTDEWSFTYHGNVTNDLDTDLWATSLSRGSDFLSMIIF